jgi:hypothetical protein
LFLERLGREVRALHNPGTEGKSVKCDICDEDFANSVELEKHKEREHPMGDGDEKLEKPDMMPENVQQAPVVPGKTN